VNQVLSINPVLVAIVWAAVGAAGGWLVRWGSVRLARLEELEPGSRGWQVYGPPIASALLFAAFGYEFGAELRLLLDSVWVLVLVQVIFFDFEHRLILDRVLFPSMVLALVVSLFGQTWWEGIAIGFGVGLLFLLIGLVGSFVFKAEALGFGDVKFALFMGLLLGPFGLLPTMTALFDGVVLAALGSVVVIVRERSLKGSLAYGPFLAAGTLIVLFQSR
jgi:leader peptidase (prepilin peptidase)/N-methyltransferase